MCPWGRHLTLTAPDELAVALHGWLCRWCVNVCIKRCKSLWIKASAKCPNCKLTRGETVVWIRETVTQLMVNWGLDALWPQFISNKASVLKAESWSDWDWTSARDFETDPPPHIPFLNILIYINIKAWSRGFYPDIVMLHPYRLPTITLSCITGL